jgi:2-phospho-L-lactate guanylyltransferase
MHPPHWTIILPVKRLVAGKSRLRAAADGRHGIDDLVLAIALDTIATVLAVPSVGRAFVVTDDAAVAARAASLGATVVADPATGLNGAIRAGEAAAGLAGARAALLADLPALRASELAAALHDARGRRSFQSDHAGTGTTMLAAPAGTPLEPCFGADSAARHAASGAVALDGLDRPGLRLDVDTADDVAAAMALGVGPYTAGALVAAGFGSV